jgi:RNase H-like domain found in reverse transcriptase
MKDPCPRYLLVSWLVLCLWGQPPHLVLSGFFEPAIFFSKTIALAQCNYPIHDKEMLAIICALREWRAELEGAHSGDRFDIFSDHHAPEYFMATKALGPRIAAWAEFLSRFYFTVRCCPGKTNVIVA